MLGDHPVRPFFMKPQTSDSTSIPGISPITVGQRSALHPYQDGGPGGRRLPGHAFWVPGWLHRFRRRYSSIALRMATAHSHPSLRLGRAAGNHVPLQGGKPDGLLDGVFGRAPVPEARPPSGEDLSTCLPGGSGGVGRDDVGGVPVQAAACP
jgi:hypothetical protein